MIRKSGRLYICMVVCLVVSLLTVLTSLWPLKILKLSNLGGTRTVPGLSLDSLWTVSGQSLDCLWTVSRPSLNCIWTVSELSLVCLWTVSGMSLNWLTDWLTWFVINTTVFVPNIRLLTNRGPDQSGSYLILNWQPPYQSGTCLWPLMVMHSRGEPQSTTVKVVTVLML